MKKIAFVAAAVLLAASASAQTALTQVFKVDSASTLSWFGNDNNTRGLALNPSTGNLIFADRTPADKVISVNPTTGAELVIFQTGTVITGGTATLLKAGVDGDGRVYGTNLSGSAASTLKVYRWDSELLGATTDPVVVATHTGIAQRSGDDMAITGSGANVKLLLSGSGGTTEVSLLTDPENDGSFAIGIISALPAFVGSPQVDFDPADATKFWARSVGTNLPVVQYNAAAGAAVAGGAADVVTATLQSTVTIDVAVVGGTKFVAVGPANVAATTTGVRAEVIKADDSTVKFTAGPLEAGSAALANGNASGDIVLSTGGTLYVLYTNNSISAWSGASEVEDWNML